MPFKIKDVVLIDSGGEIFANVVKPTVLRSVYRGIGGVAVNGYIGGGGQYGLSFGNSNSQGSNGNALSGANQMERCSIANETYQLIGTELGSNNNGMLAPNSTASTSNAYYFGRDFGANKFPFANDTTSTYVFPLATRRVAQGGSAQSLDHGYIFAGTGSFFGDRSERIDRHPFGSVNSSTDVGDLANSENVNVSGCSSISHGYSTGGVGNPFTATQRNIIQKWPFASASTNASDVADLAYTTSDASGHSSSDNGYVVSGVVNQPTAYFGSHLATSNDIQKFPFAADNNATDVASLGQTRRLSTGFSTSTHGVIAGGYTAAPLPWDGTPPVSPPPDYRMTDITHSEKFSFANEAASTIGSLQTARGHASGTQG